MSRLIDADAVCNTCAFKKGSLGCKHCNGYTAPTIDPESLRPKGEWIDAKVRVPNEEERDCAIVGIVNGNNGRINFNNGLIFVRYDDDCEAWWSDYYDIEGCSVDYWFAIPDFCPNCGADMRGENDG